MKKVILIGCLVIAVVALVGAFAVSMASTATAGPTATYTVGVHSGTASLCDPSDPHCCRPPQCCLVEGSLEC